MQAEDFFIPESPKENHEKDISEEELFHNIFSLTTKTRAFWWAKYEQVIFPQQPKYSKS